MVANNPAAREPGSTEPKNPVRDKFARDAFSNYGQLREIQDGMRARTASANISKYGFGGIDIIGEGANPQTPAFVSFTAGQAQEAVEAKRKAGEGQRYYQVDGLLAASTQSQLPEQAPAVEGLQTNNRQTVDLFA
jgi:hypothetical protein